jgi:hypothetical protein
MNKDLQEYLLDGMELAWSLIANAYNGDWDTAPKPWREAAERWRDEHWNSLLDRHILEREEPKTDD